MSFTAYIAATALLETNPPKGGEWHATTSMDDPTQSLVVVAWDNANAIADFESQDGVVLVGLPWETVSPDALSLLSLFQDTTATATRSASSSLPTVDSPVAVSTALRQVSWPGARLVR